MKINYNKDELIKKFSRITDREKMIVKDKSDKDIIKLQAMVLNRNISVFK